MKKFASIVLSAVFALTLLAGCGGAPSSAPASASGAAASGQQPYKVGLIQLMEHTSLDEIRAAIEAQLDLSLIHI